MPVWANTLEVRRSYKTIDEMGLCNEWRHLRKVGPRLETPAVSVGRWKVESRSKYEDTRPLGL